VENVKVMYSHFIIIGIVLNFLSDVCERSVLKNKMEVSLASSDSGPVASNLWWRLAASCVRS